MRCFFFPQVKVYNKNAISFPKLECVEFLITAIDLIPCHESTREKQPCVRLHLYLRNQNPIWGENFSLDTALPKQFWRGEVMEKDFMCLTNLVCSFTHTHTKIQHQRDFNFCSAGILEYANVYLIVFYLDWYLGVQKAAGTMSEQESLIWKQILIKKTAKCFEASNYHWKTINCMANSLRLELFQCLLESVGLKTCLFMSPSYIPIIYICQIQIYVQLSNN